MGRGWVWLQLKGKLWVHVASPTLFSLIIVIMLYSILFLFKFMPRLFCNTNKTKKKNKAIKKVKTKMKSRKIFCLFCCNLCSVFLLVAFRKYCSTIREFYCHEKVARNYKLLFSIYFNQYKLCALCGK